MDLSNDEKKVVLNLLLSYKGLSVAEAGTVLQIVQKIQVGMTPPTPEVVEPTKEEVTPPVDAAVTNP